MFKGWVALCVIFVAAFSACDQVEMFKTKISAVFGSGLKIGDTYRSLDGQSIKIVSADEFETGNGIVGKYTVEEDKVRVVFGGVKSEYYKLTEDGLEADEAPKKTFYSLDKYEAAYKRVSCDQIKSKLNIHVKGLLDKNNWYSRSVRYSILENEDFLSGDAVYLTSIGAIGRGNYKIWGFHKGCDEGHIWSEATRGFDAPKPLASARSEAEQLSQQFQEEENRELLAQKQKEEEERQARLKQIEEARIQREQEEAERRRIRKEERQTAQRAEMARREEAEQKRLARLELDKIENEKRRAQREKEVKESRLILIAGADKRNIQEIESLLNSGVNINCNNRHNTPLTSAIKGNSTGGEPDIVRLLIKRGANVNLRPPAESKSPLELAEDIEKRNRVFSGQLGRQMVINMLIDAGAR